MTIAHDTGHRVHQFEDLARPDLLVEQLVQFFPQS